MAANPVLSRGSAEPHHVHTSVVKKSAPAIAPQCARRNVCHDVGRFGAGSKPRAFKIRAIVERPTADGPTCRVLICDRDTKWSAAVRERLEEAGVRVVQPHQTLNANAYAERFVRSISEEYLDRIIPIGEGHFRRAVSEFVTPCHRERNHQGLESVLTQGAAMSGAGRVQRQSRLGGPLNFYRRAA
jgi:hypothetical protein